jgi:hypothetical protein
MLVEKVVAELDAAADQQKEKGQHECHFNRGDSGRASDEAFGSAHLTRYGTSRRTTVAELSPDATVF